jgi:hypothetical protein
MALSRQGDRPSDLVVTWKEMPRSPGHVFYDRLQGVLIDAGFDAFRGGDLQTVLCGEDGCSLASAYTRLPRFQPDHSMVAGQHGAVIPRRAHRG